MTYGHYASTIYYIGGSWDRAIQKHNEIQAIILEAYGAESQISAAYFKHKAALYFDAQEIEVRPALSIPKRDSSFFLVFFLFYCFNFLLQIPLN
jgi:hypothetical protein